jgi:hypothetical protein
MGLLANNALESVWADVSLTQFCILCLHLFGEAEKSLETSRSGQQTECLHLQHTARGCDDSDSDDSSAGNEMNSAVRAAEFKDRSLYRHVSEVPSLITTGSWQDDWIYWHLIHISRTYKQYSSVADLHNLQFIIIHALGQCFSTAGPRPGQLYRALVLEKNNLPGGGLTKFEN